jgi:hypothetical protein
VNIGPARVLTDQVSACVGQALSPVGEALDHG